MLRAIARKDITLKKLITIIAILHFIFLSAAYPNTLWVGEQRDIVAETENYLARFEEGVLVHFHNKLTQETYTYENLTQEGEEWWGGETLFTTMNHRINHPKIVEKISPLEVKITYQEHGATHHFFVAIDPKTSDLLIQQTGISQNGGAHELMWGFKNLSHASTDIILPCTGGLILNQENPEHVAYGYPGHWEAQLAIFQGQRGGFFVRNNDTQFRFKEFRYERRGENFRVSFMSIAFAPFEKRKQFTSGTWRLNAYQGGWQVPASIYKDWMHDVFPPADRSKMPAWVNDIDCIIKNHGEFDIEMLRILNQLVDPSKTLIYIYGWHEDGGDPPHRRDGFKPNLGNFVKEAQRYGFRTMLHTSISHIQADDPFYPEFEKYHVRDPRSGEKVGYKLNDPTYHSPAATINPASNAFRKMLVSELKYVWETHGVDAFQLDFSISVINDKNGRIDGLTMAEGIIFLHQEIREAMPGIVLSGESLTELTAPYEDFTQRWNLPENLQPHPISTFLFPDLRLYGHLGLPNPDDDFEQFQARQLEYTLWGVLPTITVWIVESLGPDRVETHKLLELVRQRQNYVFGDANSDGIVNILDLTFTAQYLGVEEPSNRRLDANKDGVVNILDLILVAKQL